MSDYTPTKQAVCYAYMMQKQSSSWGTRDNTPDYEDEFERWLAKEKTQTAKVERERIIKLLEDAITDDEDAYRINWAIEIIKGKNSE